MKLNVIFAINSITSVVTSILGSRFLGHFIYIFYLKLDLHVYNELQYKTVK